MLKKLAQKLSNEEGNFSYEVNLYLLRSFIHMLATLVLLLTIAYLLGVFKWTLIIILTTMILRSSSGGSHSKSKITCSVLTLIIPTSFAFFVDYFVQILTANQVLSISLLVFIIGLIIIHKYAPADTPQKPIVSSEFKKQLRRNSYIFVILIQLIALGLYGLNYNYTPQISISFTLGVGWQLFTLTPLGYRFLRIIDALF